MDTNYRGGPNGFVRLISNDGSGVKLVWPEYSGNRLYQTLGNLMVNPLAGLVFPDFETGDALYVTGRAEILAGSKAASVIVHSKLAVLFHVDSARMVRQTSGFRAEALDPSPYNPTVRLLASERRQLAEQEGSNYPTIRLLRHQRITPTISRFTFAFNEDSATNNVQYRAGQWAALDFSGALDVGYSHMKDDDPRLLNDDFIRSFTVTSTPSVESWDFDITVRKVGRVTDYLFDRADKGVPVEAILRGFGGEFKIDTSSGKIAFIASGVGITPLYSAASQLQPEQVHILWTLNSQDIGLVLDLLALHPTLAASTTLFVTGQADQADFSTIEENVRQIHRRRVEASDLLLEGVKRWYCCTSPQFRRSLQEWLPHVQLEYEDFSY